MQVLLLLVLGDPTHQIADFSAEVVPIENNGHTWPEAGFQATTNRASSIGNRHDGERSFGAAGAMLPTHRSFDDGL